MAYIDIKKACKFLKIKLLDKNKIFIVFACLYKLFVYICNVNKTQNKNLYNENNKHTDKKFNNVN